MEPFPGLAERPGQLHALPGAQRRSQERGVTDRRSFVAQREDVAVDAASLRSGGNAQPGWELLAACTDIDIADVMPARGAVHSAPA